MNYRAEIDGLRALAVLSVILFHAFPSILSGGFVGVDIFFVISGYLISGIIFDGLDKGAFRFLEFYGRRIRRIFPSLLIVIFVSILIGALVLLSDQYAKLGKHVANGSLFVINFALVGEAGYFDTASETKPLLHLWSLAVEEQFYILWPLLLWLVRKKKALWFLLAVILALVSFGINVDWVPKGHAKAFFLPQARFWELLSGAMLAWLSIYRIDALRCCRERVQSLINAYLLPNKLRIKRPSVEDALCFVGFMLLFGSMVLISGRLPYPSFWGLLPVLGASLVIASGSKGWLNQKLLMNPVAVWFGLISYPLYLWHWPLLSFLRIIIDDTPPIIFRLLAVILSVLLAFLTFRFIEQPLRFGRRRWVKTVALCGAMAIVGAGGYVISAERGVPQRYRLITKSTTDFELLKVISDAWEFRGYPTPVEMFADPITGFHRMGKNDQSKVLMIGDSHTVQYFNSFTELYSANGADIPSIVFNNGAHFPPVPNDAPIAKDPAIRTVALSFYWALHYGSNKVNQELRCCGSGKNGTIGVASIPYKTPVEMDKIDESIEDFILGLRNSGINVFIVLDNPFGEELNAQSMIYRDGLILKLRPNATLSRKVVLERSEPVRGRIVKIARKTGASIIDPMQYLCKEDICPAFSEHGELLYKDYDHLSLFASRHSAQYIRSVLGRP